MAFWRNILGPRQRFEGGLFLPDYKAITARRPVEDVTVGGPLHVPLQAARGLETVVEIEIGQRVRGGQRLARAAGPDSLPVHAPTSGTVAAIGRVWAATSGYLPGVVLDPDGLDDWAPCPRTWDTEPLARQLADCAVLCTSPLAPAHCIIQEAAAAGVTDLIVNAMETEPFLSADLRTLVEEPGRLIDAITEIAAALGVHRCLLALPFRHRRVVRRIEAGAIGHRVEVAPLSDRYPQCHPVVLVKTLLDREVAPGENVLDAGVLVLPLAVVRQMAEALLNGRPITRAVLTVAGDAVDRPGTYRLAVGTPLRRLAEHVGLVAPVAQAVVGGPLTGLQLGHEDAVVTADMTALLLFAKAHQPNPLPCIHCGWCVEDCPVGLNPSELIQLEAMETCDAVALARLRACVDCGLCSYVCPSQLPLAASIRQARARFGQAAESAEAVGA